MPYHSIPKLLIALVLVGLVGTLAIPALSRGCSGRHTGSGPEAKPVYARDEFEHMIVGMDENQVFESVGPPDRTASDTHSKTWFWHYLKRTRDPVTQKLDSDAQVVFEEGRVVKISY
jgi:hypothetical protein